MARAAAPGPARGGRTPPGVPCTMAVRLVVHSEAARAAPNWPRAAAARQAGPCGAVRQPAEQPPPRQGCAAPGRLRAAATCQAGQAGRRGRLPGSCPHGKAAQAPACRMRGNPPSGGPVREGGTAKLRGALGRAHGVRGGRTATGPRARAGAAGCRAFHGKAAQHPAGSARQPRARQGKRGAAQQAAEQPPPRQGCAGTRLPRAGSRTPAGVMRARVCRRVPTARLHGTQRQRPPRGPRTPGSGRPRAAGSRARGQQRARLGWGPRGAPCPSPDPGKRNRPRRALRQGR